MNIHLYYIKANVLLTPGYCEYWCKGPKKIVLIEASDDLMVQSQEKKLLLPRGSIAIGTNLQIVNHLSTFVLARAVAFCFSKESVLLKSPIVIDRDDLTKKYIEQITEIFSLENISVKRIQHITECFSILLKKLNVEENVKAEHLTGEINSRLLMVNRVIRDSYYEPITLDYLADLIKCNPVYLSNAYTKVFNISPKKHLQLIRIKKAQELLENTNLPINKIAKSVGYISNSHFTSYFKKYVGVTPVEYRKTFVENTELRKITT